jgi:RNA polymerase sigma-70 factor (ECF subfamily)
MGMTTMELEIEYQNEDPLTTQVRLVTAAQLGDRAAFGQLCEQFQRAVYAIAFRRLGDHAEAQEVCQEVFIQAMRKIGQLRDPHCFAGWLRSMAARMSLNRAMRGPRMPAMPETLEVACPGQQTPLAEILDQESRAQVHSGLDRLSTLDRETLVAFYFDGRSLIEMSDQFHTPVGTIKRRLHVARKRLARELATTMV